MMHLLVFTHKPVQLVTVLNSVGNCNTMVGIILYYCIIYINIIHINIMYIVLYI
jgi:hypothetical protein